MKNKNTFKSATAVLILIMISAELMAQFTGTMVFNNMGKERHFKVYQSDAGYRYNFDEDGQQGAVIVKTGSAEVIMLMPQQNMAMKTPAGSPMSMGSDPLKSFEHYQEGGIMKQEGKENINGIECTKSTLWNAENPDQKMFTMWFSDKYKFPMKMINHIDGQEDSGMEMRDVQSWSPDPGMFEIPDGYQVMEMPGMGQ